MGDNLFMMFAPLEGWRHVKVMDRHTAVDYARALKDLSDAHFPDARKIILVQDNSPRARGVRRAPLNTHKPASLHEAFPAAEARRLVERFEWHYTPKHGGWLASSRARRRMAESEFGVLYIPMSRSRNRRLGGRSKCQPRQGRLAVHHSQSTYQTQASIRVNLTESLPRL
jgi:hypothetical protein